MPKDKTETHFACVNTAICNKYGYQPNKKCSENECKYVVEFDSAAQEELYRSAKSEKRSGRKKGKFNNNIFFDTRGNAEADSLQTTLLEICGAL